MKRVLVSAVALAAAVGVANAADIRRPPPPAAKAPAYVAPLFTWTGFYLGGNLGYGWSDGSGTVNIAGVNVPINGDGDGVIGGVQAGYNWQTGAFVWGVETDFQLSGGTGNFRGSRPGIVITGTADNEWFGTIRGRLGYAVDRWLFYVTGGGYYTHNKSQGTVNGIAFASSATGWGWTIGGGVEMALLNNWSIKGEYLYLDTPDKVPDAGRPISGDINSHVFRVGLNYRF